MASENPRPPRGERGFSSLPDATTAVVVPADVLERTLKREGIANEELAEHLRRNYEAHLQRLPLHIQIVMQHR